MKQKISGCKSKRQYTVAHSPEMLELALECLRKKEMSSYEAEKRFGIPRRTLLDKLKNKHVKNVGCPTRLSTKEENEIIKVLVAAADFGSPFSMLDLRIMVHKYLVTNGRDSLFNGKMPGEKWAYGFLKRHRNQLSLRATANIKKARAEKSCEELSAYFKNLKESLTDVPKQNILNYDETNLSDDPGKAKCIVKRGTKYPERIMNHTKGCISIMFAATADGKILPPYVVYKSKQLWQQWVTGGPPHTRYNHSASGWFDSAIFEDWFASIVIPWAKKLPGTKIVVGDNLASHLNPTVLSLCEKHQIRFVLLPTNSTHLTQPLDVCVYGPLKRIWRKVLTRYKMEHPSEQALNKCLFPGLLSKLMNELSERKCNIISSFAATGIYPFNPKNVLKRLPDSKEVVEYGIDQAVIDYLKEIRTPKTQEKKVRNKKLKIEPGKSVSAGDFNFSVNLDFKLKAKKSGDSQQKVSQCNGNNSSNINITSNVLIAKGNNVKNTNNNNILEQPDESNVLFDNANISCKLTPAKRTKMPKPNIYTDSKTSDEDKNEYIAPTKKVITPLKQRISQADDTDKDELSVFFDNANISCKFTPVKKTNMPKRNIYMDSNTSDEENENNTPKQKVITPIKQRRSQADDTDEDDENYSLHDTSNDYQEEGESCYEYEEDRPSNSEDELGNEEIEPLDDDNDKDPEQGDYLLVKFTLEKGDKYYVGRVLNVENPTNFKVKFLRHKGKGKFAWPINDDISAISRLDIEKVLSEPITERRGILKFDISKWCYYNIG